MALLEVEELRVGYGFPVLLGISFAVEEGETAVLFGLNGAGKTTTVATIAGLLRPDSGSIRFDGEEVAGWSPTKLVDRGIALVPEGLPRRFRWRGVTHGVARIEGPERIADEWWRSRAPRPTRDYYLVEDEAGRRFWLYREGIYGRETDAPPRWFVHGVFA